MSAVAEDIPLKTGKDVFDDILDAAARLEGVARRTPVLTKIGRAHV